MSREPGRVYVGDLGSGGSKPELEREFERYGPLKSVWVARNPPGELPPSFMSPPAKSSRVSRVRLHRVRGPSRRGGCSERHGRAVRVRRQNPRRVGQV